MKTVIDKLTQLADSLDGLGLNKYADQLDQLVAKAAHGEDFGDLMSLFDGPVTLEDSDDAGPGGQVVVLDEPEIHTPLDEEEAPLSKEKTNPGASRLEMLKRRQEILKLKMKLEKAEKMEKALEDEVSQDELKLPVATPEDLSFEDEDDEDIAMNEADDSLIETLQEKLKEVPELAKQLLQLVKDNPELLALLAL